MAKLTNSSFGRSGKSFGGSLLKKSNAKSKRPLSTNLPIHLVMSPALHSQQLDPNKNLLLKEREIHRIAHTHARRNKIKIHQMLNGGIRLHLILRLPKKKHLSRRLYNNFIRALSGEVARLMTGARKTRPAPVIGHNFSVKKKAKSFWAQRPFTQVLSEHSPHYIEIKKQLKKAAKVIKNHTSHSAGQSIADLSKLFPHTGFS